MPILALALMLPLLGTAQTDFRSHWGDWKAEIDSYQLVQPRYGEARKGTAVMIWVTEPFSVEKHVKPDQPTAGDGKTAHVLKLNMLRRFTTGIYDYSLMLSVFSPLVFDEQHQSPGDHRPLKVTFTGQDWCGHVFHQLDTRGATLESQWNSYFESEGDGREKLPLTADTLLEDELWFRLRGLTVPLKPGKYRFVPSVVSARLAHTPLSPGTMQLSEAKRESITVPAGTFATRRHELVLSFPDSRPKLKRQIWVEEAYPHRIVSWTSDALGFRGKEPTQERGQLMGSVRDTYWQHNRVQDEPARRALRLAD
ncbi:MAG: hypothetical protein ACKVPX_01165 [Myxococcaceae bacterium]